MPEDQEVCISVNHGRRKNGEIKWLVLIMPGNVIFYANGKFFILVSHFGCKISSGARNILQNNSTLSLCGLGKNIKQHWNHDGKIFLTSDHVLKVSPNLSYSLFSATTKGQREELF